MCATGAILALFTLVLITILTLFAFSYISVFLCRAPSIGSFSLMFVFYLDGRIPSAHWRVSVARIPCLSVGFYWPLKGCPLPLVHCALGVCHLVSATWLRPSPCNFGVGARRLLRCRPSQSLSFSGSSGGVLSVLRVKVAVGFLPWAAPLLWLTGALHTLPGPGGVVRLLCP